jgi:hypothetical protein
VRTHFCRPCDREVVAVRPHWAWRAALVAVALAGVATVLASSLIGPFIVGAIPFMALYGFALGPIAREVSTPPTCPHCGRETPHRARAEAPRHGERESEKVGSA